MDKEGWKQRALACEYRNEELATERDAALGRVEALELRLSSGIALVNAAIMGMRSAAPKLKAWAESKEGGA